MKTYNKLVRDKIPEILDKKGVKYEKRIASKSEYKVALSKKLIEEVSEFQEENSVEELADVVEVIRALKKLPKYKNVEKIRVKKAKERGFFEKRIILKGKY